MALLVLLPAYLYVISSILYLNSAACSAKLGTNRLIHAMECLYWKSSEAILFPHEFFISSYLDRFIVTQSLWISRAHHLLFHAMIVDFGSEITRQSTVYRRKKVSNERRRCSSYVYNRANSSIHEINLGQGSLEGDSTQACKSAALLQPFCVVLFGWITPSGVRNA